MSLPAKYRSEALSMARELARKAAKLERKLTQLDDRKGALTVRILNEAQELGSLARDIELSIYVTIEARKRERGKA